ncbi:LOB domain-containing protein 4-like [Triticum dicoccoides]|uniref:LOB domain-containing protein 4-like n=1 Tax=Triticum dicoccoides TaxID=85692 RepID=UPI000843E93A|nr:LOB domain-containing protein 4-like [Triticum dicoccoides]XP_044344145.1 LOB domain-containing protein 4-like [Triticum aestivum]
MPAARQQQQQQQPACAACKHQRRRCTAECPLARYFPHDRPGLFRSAHRLFGVSNILKTLRRAGPDRARRDDAMRGLAYEAAAWDTYPAGGCLPAIVALESQLRQEHGILRCLQAQIHHYRRRLEPSPPLSLPPPTGDVPPAPTEGSNMHYLDEHKYVPASSGLYGNDNGDDGVVAAPSLPWKMQPQYYEGAIANMGGVVGQEENQYQLLFDHTATAGGHQHEYDEISPFLELEGIDADDHHDRTPPDESNSSNSWKKKEIKPSTKMELN